METSNLEQKLPQLAGYLTGAFDAGTAPSDEESSQTYLRSLELNALFEVKHGLQYCIENTELVKPAVEDLAYRTMMCVEHLHYWLRDRLDETNQVISERTGVSGT